MSFLIAAPGMVTDAATNLASIGSTISAANAAAAAPTTGVLVAGADEVSAAITTLFSGHAQQFQALSAQAAAFHAEFVQALNGAVGSYAAAEAANVSPLQTLEQDVLGLINLPTDVVLGRPLIGAGANGTTNGQGVGTPGGGGGILIGSGGNGGDSIAAGVPGGVGGPAGLIGIGGTGGMGGFGASGGGGGTGGWLWGNGGPGGIGGPFSTGGVGGSALFVGSGGPGGLGGELGGSGGTGGSGGLLIGSGGTGGTGGVSGGAGSAIAGGHGGAGGAASFLSSPGATGAHGGSPDISVDVNNQISRPYIDISIGGGPASKVTLDTGSIGLIVPPQDVNLASLGPSLGSFSVKYGDGSLFTTENYNLYDTIVNFGNGIITTTPTQVGVVTSVTQQNGSIITNLPASSANATCGVGASNSYIGPFSVSPVQSLPGPLSHGLLIDEPKSLVQFGANPLTPIASVTGAPVTTMGISINGGGVITTPNSTILDTGGLWGDVPSSYGTGETIDGYVPQHTTIDYYVGNTFIFGETIGTSSTAPVVGPSTDWFNTGNSIYEYTPTWLGYTGGQGTLSFD